MRKVKELTEEQKLERIKRLVSNNRWFNKKNIKHLRVSVAHYQSTYSNQDHTCPYTGKHALCFIEHKRLKNNRIVSGISNEAVSLIEQVLGNKFEFSYAP